MNGSLMTRAVLQKHLAGNFEKEADRLRGRLVKHLKDLTDTPERDLAELQRISTEYGQDRAHRWIKERYQLPSPLVRQIQDKLDWLNLADHETVNIQQGLQTTTMRRKRRQRQ